MHVCMQFIQIADNLPNIDNESCSLYIWNTTSTLKKTLRDGEPEICIQLSNTETDI